MPNKGRSYVALQNVKVHKKTTEGAALNKQITDYCVHPQPFITICMPIYNEAKYISKTLDSILAQIYPQDCFEIIIADGGSTDGSLEIIERYIHHHKKIRLFPNNKKLSSAGRNIGFKHAKGDIVLVVDGHCYIPSETMLRDIVEIFSSTQADCLARPQLLNPPDISSFQEAVSLSRSSWIGHARDSMIYSDYEGFVSPVSHGAIYKRHVIETVGLIDESFDACEDLDFNYRVHASGFKAFMSPKLTVKYFPRDNVFALFKQVARYGRGRVCFILKHPEVMSIDMILAPVPCLGIIFLPVAYFLSLQLFALALLPFILYAIWVLLCMISVCMRHRFSNIIYLIMACIAIHYGFSYGFLKETITSGRLKSFVAAAWNWISGSKLRSFSGAPNA